MKASIGLRQLEVGTVGLRTGWKAQISSALSCHLLVESLALLATVDWTRPRRAGFDPLAKERDLLLG